MFNLKSSSKLSATLLALIMGASVFMAGQVWAAKMVKDPTTGKMVTAPAYGGTLTFANRGCKTIMVDSWFGGFSGSTQAGVTEKLGIARWEIDRDQFSLRKTYVLVSVIGGALAESWEQPDPNTYVFRIREGVRWFDKAPMNGRELTAEDVVFNWHRMVGMGEFTAAGGSPSQALKDIPFESITATDRYTVVFKTTEPQSGLQHTLLVHHSSWVYPPEVIEEHGDLQDWRNSVGTGPYMLTDAVEGSSITWTKNPDYWRFDEKYPENRLPYIDEFKVLTIEDEATVMAALRSGKLDYRRWAPDLDSVLSLKRTNPEIVAHPILFWSNNAFAPNHRVPPFNDINVVRAMQMALDNEIAAATYWKGQADATPRGLQGVKGYYIPFEEWDEEVKQYYRYDPEGAEKLLDEAGYKRGADGTRFKTVLNTGSFASLEFAEIAAAYWAEIGVDVDIDALSYAEYQERVYSRTGEGMYMAIGGCLLDPVRMTTWYHSDDRGNRGGSQWPELDAMVDAVLDATTIEEQKRLIAEADKYAMSRHWLIWGPRSPTFRLVQPWVKGYNGEFDQGLDAGVHTIFARLWIDSELKEAMGH